MRTRIVEQGRRIDGEWLTYCLANSIRKYNERVSVAREMRDFISNNKERLVKDPLRFRRTKTFIENNSNFKLYHRFHRYDLLKPNAWDDGSDFDITVSSFNSEYFQVDNAIERLDSMISYNMKAHSKTLEYMRNPALFNEVIDTFNNLASALEAFETSKVIDELPTKYTIQLHLFSDH